MSEESRRIVQQIRDRLHALARRMSRAELAFGAIVLLGALCMIVFLATGLEAVLWFDVPVRLIVFWTAISALALLVAAFLIRPLLRWPRRLSATLELKVAGLVGAQFPEIADRLTNMLQLASGHSSGGPSALIDRAIGQLGDQVSNVDYSRVEGFERVRKASRWAVLPLLAVVVFVAAAPGPFTGAAERLLAPGTAFLRPAAFTLSVEPGNIDILRGDPLRVSVTAAGRNLPTQVRLQLRRPDESRWVSRLMEPDSAGTFRYSEGNVRETIQYRIIADPVESSTFVARVVQRPTVGNLEVVVRPPRYSGLPVRTLPLNTGDVVGLPGSRVSITTDVRGENVDSARIVFDNGLSVPLELNGESASGVFILRRSGSYYLRLRDASGIENADPIEYTLQLRRDEAPSIVLLAPNPDTELDENLSVDLRARIVDDFGFSSLTLFYRLSESRFEEPSAEYSALPIPLETGGQLDLEVQRVWDLLAETDLDLVPGDAVEYYLEIKDNDSFSGFKAARTGMLTLRFPSLAEQFEQLDEDQDAAQSEMESLLDASDELREEFEELRDDLREDREIDWEDERQLERLQEQQADIEERVEELARAMEEMVQSMDQNNMLSPETMEKFKELQNAFQEVNSPELMDALNKLREAMQELDLSQLQQSLGDFEFSEEMYRERLERMLELFKRLRAEQKLEEAALRAEDLARLEEKLKEQTAELGKLSEEEPEGADDENAGDEEGAAESEQAPSEDDNAEDSDSESDGDPSDSGAQSPEELAEQQDQASEDMEELEELLEDILEQMGEIPNAPEQNMDRLLDDVERQNIPGQMQINSQQLRQNQLQNAQQGQQQMQQSLEQMAQQIGQMQQQMSAEQMEANIQALRRALDDVLTLSREQEGLRNDVAGLSARESGLRRFAQQQIELAEALAVVSDSLQTLSRNIPQMPQVIQRHAGAASKDMERALGEMAERRGARAIGHQKSSMSNLNELAKLLSDLMQSLQSGQGGMPGMSMQQMMQQLQQMAGQQGQLNQQMQQLLNDIQGNRLSLDQQGRLQQMAQQQEALRQQLEEMARDGDAAAEKLLGDLNQIGRQMEETVQELRNQSADQRTIDRQEEILTRLLNAQRSMRERGRERKREGRTGQDVDRPSPTDVRRSAEVDRLRRELLRALESGYSADYEDLIRRYFEALQNRSGSDSDG